MAATPANYGSSGVKPMGYEATTNFILKIWILLLMPYVFCIQWPVIFQTVLKGDEHWLPICDGGGEKSGPETACKYLPRLI